MRPSISRAAISRVAISRVAISRAALVTLLGVSLPLSAATVAFAHGGAYQPPAGEVPADSRDPHDPPPPPDGSGPGTPGGEDGPGPTTPGGGDVPGPGTPGGVPGGGAPTGGGAPPPPTGGGTGGVHTGGGRPRARAAGFDDWQWWWASNEAEILALHGRVRRQRAPLSGSGVHVFGARGGSGDDVRLATDAVMVTDVLPLLRDVLANKDENFDVRSAAALAVAKIGDVSAAPELRTLARGDEKGAHRVVIESSALALGLLAQDDAATRDCLLEIAGDRERKGSFARPFAEVALGFQPATGDAAAAVRALLVDVTAGRESGEDAKPASLLALGLRGDADALADLLAMVRTGRAARDGANPLSDVEISYAVSALGRIGAARGDTQHADASGVDAATAGEIIETLVRAATDERASKHVVRSAVAALGRAAPAAPSKLLERAVEVLIRASGDDTDDSQTRNFALIALGRTGGDRRTSDAVRKRCVDALGKTLDKGRPASLVQPFAALGLGLVVHGREGSAAVDDETLRLPLRQKFAKERDPGARSAFAIASGLARDLRAVEPLLAVLNDTTAPARLRGFCALAVGLVKYDAARDDVRIALAESKDRELSLHAAMAAGLLGDPRAVDDLVGVLRDPDRSQYVLGSVAIALGHIGDERAIGPLCAIVKDAKRWPDLTRALAVVALGRIGDRRDVPLLARIGTDFNYRANVPATRELLTIL